MQEDVLGHTRKAHSAFARGDMRAAPAIALVTFIGAKPHTGWVADAVVR